MLVDSAVWVGAPGFYAERTWVAARGWPPGGTPNSQLTDRSDFILPNEFSRNFLSSSTFIQGALSYLQKSTNYYLLPLIICLNSI